MGRWLLTVTACVCWAGLTGAPASGPGTSTAASAPAGAAALREGLPLIVEETAGTALDNVPAICGVPFPPGALADGETLALYQGPSRVPADVEVTSRYGDGSVRSVLLRFRATLRPWQRQTLRLAVTAAPMTGPTSQATTATGPVAVEPFVFHDNLFMRLPVEWYCGSGVFGPIFPAVEDRLCPELEKRIDRVSAAVAGRRFDIDAHGYYDRAHAQHMVFLRTGSEQAYFDARRWAVYYQQEHARWLARYRPEKFIDWYRLRRMYVEGLLEDYLLTGDPRSREVAVALGEALLASMSANAGSFRVNERNPSFPLMNLTMLYELTGQQRYLDAAGQIARTVCAWRNAARGGWIRIYEDRAEWDDPAVQGGSPFMTTLLMEGLIRYHRLTGDRDVAGAILGGADWLIKECWWPSLGRPDLLTFTYIQAPAPGRGQVYDLNMMFLEMLGYAWHLTGQSIYRDVARDALRGGLEDFGSHGKAYNQAMRGLARGLYWLQAPPRPPAQAATAPASSRSAAAS